MPPFYVECLRRVRIHAGNPRSLRSALSVVCVSRAREWNWANQELSVVGLADEIDPRKWMSSSVRSVRSWLGTCRAAGHTKKWFLKLKVSSAVTYGATSGDLRRDWAAPPAKAESRPRWRR